MPKKISIEEALRFGWASFKKHWKFLLSAVVILYFVGALSNYLSDGVFQDIQPTASLIELLFSVAIMLLYFNILRSVIAIVDDKTPTVNDLFTYDKSFISFVVASILYGIVVAVGYVLLIVPGVYLSLRYGMYTYIIADRGLGPIVALRESARITDGAKWQLFFMALASLFVLLLGILALLVGWFVALPVVGVAYAFVYRSLMKQSGEMTPVVSDPKPVVPAEPVATTSTEVPKA